MQNHSTSSSGSQHSSSSICSCNSSYSSEPSSHSSLSSSSSEIFSSRASLSSSCPLRKIASVMLFRVTFTPSSCNSTAISPRCTQHHPVWRCQDFHNQVVQITIHLMLTSQHLLNKFVSLEPTLLSAKFLFLATVHPHSILLFRFRVVPLQTSLFVQWYPMLVIE